MRLTRTILAVLALFAVAGLAYVAQQNQPTGADMVVAATEYLESLSAEQKAKTTFAFDSMERTNWHFIPLEKDGKSTRKGLPLEEMNAGQKKAALALLRASTSAKGDQTATTIMSLESILKGAEKKGPIRNSEWYFFTIFGSPSKTGSWGWRVEGHHLSLNFTLDGTQVVSSTPSFFGANPAEIKSGPKQGLRILENSEDRARELYESLSADQKKIATQEKAFSEPKAQSVTADVGEPVGISVTQLTEEQRGMLRKLAESYIERCMSPEVAAIELNRAREAGLDKIHFAYQGSTKIGTPHSYRVQGPTFVIEFLNIQADSSGNPANHIHSAWRSIDGDFGIRKR